MKKLFAVVGVVAVLMGCIVDYNSKYSNYKHPYYQYQTHDCMVYLGGGNYAQPYIKIMGNDTTYRLKMHVTLGTEFTARTITHMISTDSLKLLTSNGPPISLPIDSAYYLSKWVYIQQQKVLFIKPTYQLTKDLFYKLRTDTIKQFRVYHEDKAYLEVLDVKKNVNYLTQSFGNLLKISRGMPVDTTTH